MRFFTVPPGGLQPPAGTPSGGEEAAGVHEGMLRAWRHEEQRSAPDYVRLPGDDLEPRPAQVEQNLAVRVGMARDEIDLGQVPVEAQAVDPQSAQADALVARIDRPNVERERGHASILQRPAAKGKRRVAARGGRS